MLADMDELKIKLRPHPKLSRWMLTVEVDGASFTVSGPLHLVRSLIGTLGVMAGEVNDDDREGVAVPEGKR